MNHFILLKLLQLYLRSGIRGSWRLTDTLSFRFRSLQAVPVRIDGGTLYADLRIGSARGIFASPKSSSGEDIVMRQFVRPGDVVFDIGAHLGFYTLLLSKLVGERGKVYAFEPNPELLPGLQRTLTGNDRVELFPIALSNVAGEIELFVPEDASMASLANWTKGSAGRVHSVSCEKKVLDEMYDAREIKRPAFIKCDVEGAELTVFSGAHFLLDQVDAPVVLFELNGSAARAFGKNSRDYFSFFRSLKRPGYRFYHVTSLGINDNFSEDLPFANILAVPAARQP